MANVTLKDYVRKKVLNILGYAQVVNPMNEDDRLTFINDKEMIVKHRIREYNVWYEGDGEELLNFYTHHNTIESNYEPFYSRNKKNYFWAISSTEGDFKRTHSGQPKNIIDTLVSIMGVPDLRGGHAELKDNNKINEVLNAVVEENDFWNMIYKGKQMPLTMVEGWGCYKVAWDKTLSDYPIPIYYRAEDVDFIYKLNRIVGVIFKDYYTNGKKQYLITETRHKHGKDLICEKEIFEMNGSDDMASLKPLDFKDVEGFENIDPRIKITNFKWLLAEPCVFYRDTTEDAPGRSVFSGKVALFDDLDQLVSQDANAVRKSTPIEYFDVNYLDRDSKTGLPAQPHAYDRKYVFYKGSKNADGTAVGPGAVITTQPAVNFQMYSTEAQAVLLQIMNGLISPATLGIDIAKKDNAAAQREKEKITMFTRQNMAESERKILKSLFNQILCAKELMDKGTASVQDYDIQVTFPEFADDSYENKIIVLGDQLDKGNISHEMYLKKLYGGKLSDSEYNAELKFLREMHQPEQGMDQFGDGGGVEDGFGLQTGNDQGAPGLEGLQKAIEEQNLDQEQA